MRVKPGRTGVQRGRSRGELGVATFIALGVVTGLVNGFLGIGGGSFLVPILVFLIGLDEHLAHGTTLAVILPTSAISALIYSTHRLVDYDLAWKAAIGGAVGAFAGALLMEHIAPGLLRRVFAAFLALAALRMLLAGVLR